MDGLEADGTSSTLNGTFRDDLGIDVGEVFGPFGEEPFFLDLSGKSLGSLLWRVDSLVGNAIGTPWSPFWVPHRYPMGTHMGAMIIVIDEDEGGV